MVGKDKEYEKIKKKFKFIKEIDDTESGKKKKTTRRIFRGTDSLEQDYFRTPKIGVLSDDINEILGRRYDNDDIVLERIKKMLVGATGSESAISEEKRFVEYSPEEKKLIFDRAHALDGVEEAAVAHGVGEYTLYFFYPEGR